MAADYQEHFVDQHKEELIFHIGNVDAVLSQLLYEKLIVTEQYEAVKTEKSRQEKMTKLFNYVYDWNRSKKDRFYKALKANDPTTVENMERAMELDASDVVIRYINHYKVSVRQHFQLMKDRNSRMGESSPLRRRFTKLLLLKKFRSEEERKQELSASGNQHVQLMIDRLSEEYCPTTHEQLFDPDENCRIPQTVILHGPTGIGKSMTVHKILLDWATMGLYRDKFHFLFYISYRDLDKVTTNISLVKLLCRICRLNIPTEVMQEIMASSDKLGFVINGFDELKWTLRDDKTICTDPFKEVHKEVLIKSLLRRQLVQGATLLVTSRAYALKKLQSFLPEPPRFVEIVGYTGESRENYIRVYFGMRDTEKAVEITKRNEVLYTLCAVPFMCWVVSTVTKQMINKYPSNFTTDTSMFMYYLKGLLKYHSRNESVVACVKNVCALANEGILTRRIIFEEADLKRHNIVVSSVESVFLNVHVFHGDIGKRTCYSFIHQSFQELLAAVHYTMVSNEKFTKRNTSGMNAVREGTFLPEILKGRSLMELYEKYPQFVLPARFLFGLLNQEQNKDFSKTSGCQIFFQASTAMLTWFFGGEISDFNTERMLFLYETRDDDFMQYVANHAVDLTFSHSQKPDNWLFQLLFCLKACAGKKVTLYGYTLNRDQLAVLNPVLKRCSQVCFRSCHFDDNVNSSLGWKDSMFTAMVTQDSKIEDLCLVGCTLPSHTCDILDKASKQSRTLITFHVMFKAETKKEREEMRRYLDTFKSPAATMSTRKMMGKTWFLLHCKQEKMPLPDMGHFMRWDMFDSDDFPFDYRSRILFSRRHL